MGRQSLHLGIDASRDGFFVGRLPRDDPRFRAAPRAATWCAVEDALSAAKLGDFSLVAQLPDLFDGDDLALGGAMTQIVAHAGNVACFDRIHALLEAGVGDDETEINFAMALAIGGTLAAAPRVARTYVNLWHKGADGVELIPQLLGAQLEAPSTRRRRRRLSQPPMSDTGPARTARDGAQLLAYVHAVDERVAELVARLGASDVVVLHGERYDVRALALRMRNDLSRGNVALLDRMRFEATTGIDCRAFWDAGALRTQRALAIVNEFLANRASAFDVGARYFFGHRIVG